MQCHIFAMVLAIPSLKVQEVESEHCKVPFYKLLTFIILNIVFVKLYHYFFLLSSHVATSLTNLVWLVSSFYLT